MSVYIVKFSLHIWRFNMSVLLCLVNDPTSDHTASVLANLIVSLVVIIPMPYLQVMDSIEHFWWRPFLRLKTLTIIIIICITCGTLCIAIYFTEVNKLYRDSLGSHLYLSKIVVYEHVSISSSIGVRVILVTVDQSIERGIKMLSVTNSISLLGSFGP